MDWNTELNILRNIRVPYKGNLIRLLYNIIEDHKGVDFKDLEDLMQQIYPEPVVKSVVNPVVRSGRPRRY